MTELEYYKKLAALWETACNDFKSWLPPHSGAPLSYSAAVAFAHERVTAIKEVEDEDQGQD